MTDNSIEASLNPDFPVSPSGTTLLFSLVKYRHMNDLLCSWEIALGDGSKENTRYEIHRTYKNPCQAEMAKTELKRQR